ncbi:hypothetical protein RJ640_014988 [Escallonia rubra]|uniref:Reverse transcriptase domain-containing protein n=1 Tax=Escallonia rubra TaxID=112253 RepID=A0AA88UN76_9ASTE|nr:hypothetical protein RJ640_014988 [Escallonia rubra]
MPIVDMLVDYASKHAIMSFMDGNAGYNQIFLKDEDIHKTIFRCPGAIGIFEWVVMPFGLKNAGATYKREMNLIFHDMIDKFLEVYIDDVVVKSEDYQKHVKHLENAFIRMRRHGLKMNQLKCAFGVSAGEALADFLANHPSSNPEDGVIYVGIAHWRMTFDGSKTSQGAGAGIVLISPDGNIHQFDFQIEKDCSNNQAEYEALIIGLEILLDMHITTANGQAEAPNKSIKHMMDRAIEDTPNDWHPMQNSLPVAEYNEAMAIELEDLDDHRLDALERLYAQKLRVQKTQNLVSGRQIGKDPL